MIKILFIDLSILPIIGSLKGFIGIGLSYNPQSIITGEEIAKNMAIIKQTPRLKQIFIPTGTDKIAWEITNTGDVRKTPILNNGIMDFYLGRYLTRPQSWIVSDRPQSQMIIPSGTIYINGDNWQNELSRSIGTNGESERIWGDSRISSNHRTAS